MKRKTIRACDNMECRVRQVSEELAKALDDFCERSRQRAIKLLGKEKFIALEKLIALINDKKNTDG